MKLEDLYKKIESKNNQFEVLLPSGESCGNSILLKSHDDDDANIAAMRYSRLISLFDNNFKEKNKELYDECEQAKDFREYNFSHRKSLAEIEKSFAFELVSGWDFDNEFSGESLKELLDGFPSLKDQIISNFYKLAEEHAKK